MRTITTALATATVAALLTAAPAQSTQATDPRPPSRPGQVMAFGAEDGQLHLGWFEPKRSGSHPVRRYVLRWHGGRMVVPGSSTEVTVDGIEPGAYRFRVRAVSRAGAGPWSNRSQTFYVR